MTRFCWLGLALSMVVFAPACGSDDKPATTGNAASTAGAGGAAVAVSGGGSAASSGTGVEGQECAADGDCSSGLHCLIAQVVQIDANRAAGLKVCARSCSGTTGCEAGESCTVLTRDPSQALCLSVTTEPFQPCGASNTSECADGLDCLPIVTDDGGLIGVCIQACALPGSMGTAPPCPSGLSCIDGLGDESFGLCATEAARGAACDPTTGMICGKDDFCIADETNTSLCYQDCTDTMMCADGKTCMPFPDGDGAYCE